MLLFDQKGIVSIQDIIDYYSIISEINLRLQSRIYIFEIKPYHYIYIHIHSHRRLMIFFLGFVHDNLEI